MIDIFLIIIVILFIIEMNILFYGLIKSNKTKRDYSYEPNVSIIIAARNEEENIQRCLESLTKIDYPQNKVEILIINDQSTDNTEKIVRNFIRDYPQFKLINAVEGNGTLRGKTNALAQGIDFTSGEIILFTDADCIVKDSWVRETVSYYKSDIGIIAGFTLLKADNIFEGIQSLDWMFLFNVASAAATLKHPLTSVGNNLSFRKRAYEIVGGYRKIPFSVTEDYILTQTILQKTDFKMIFPLDSKTLIESLPCKNLLELYRQKQRWGVGGLNMVAAGFIIFSIPFALKLLLIVGFFLATKSIWIASFFIKIIIDFIFLSYSMKKAKRKRYLKYFLFFEIYYFIYVLILPFVSLLTKKVVWKERAF